MGTGAMGFHHGQPMGYGVSQSYGLWAKTAYEPTLFPENPMGYHRVWVMTGMGYDRDDCIH